MVRKISKRPGLILLASLILLSGCETFEGGRAAPRRGMAAAALGSGGGGSVSIGVPPTPEGLAILVGILAIKELGEEIREEMDDLDHTVDRPFPEVREAVALTLFDLGYDDIEPQDKNASAKIWGWNVHDEGLYISLKATGRDDLQTQVSIYAGENHALTERALETLHLNLGMEPPEREKSDSGEGSDHGSVPERSPSSPDSSSADRSTAGKHIPET